MKNVDLNKIMTNEVSTQQYTHAEWKTVAANVELLRLRVAAHALDSHLAEVADALQHAIKAKDILLDRAKDREKREAGVMG